MIHVEPEEPAYEETRSTLSFVASSESIRLVNVRETEGKRENGEKGHWCERGRTTMLWIR